MVPRLVCPHMAETVESMFIAHAATVLHNNNCVRFSDDLLFPTLHPTVVCVHVFTPFHSTTTTTMQREKRVDSEFKFNMNCIMQYLMTKTHLASDKRMRSAVVRAAKTGVYQVDGE